MTELADTLVSGFDVVEFLLASKAQIEDKVDGTTPLWTAASQGHMLVTRNRRHFEAIPGLALLTYQ